MYEGMETLKKIKVKKQEILFFGIFACVALLYIMNATRSPLWYDEGIEYFYSKVLLGTVPRGQDTTTMYERICITFQPPLYNVLMHIWLSFIDFNEFSFRMFGIIITLVGCGGLYKCIKELTNSAWGMAGVVAYVLTDKVMYYTLECGEYSLLLCCICWMLYFFVKDLKVPSNKWLAGFFLLAVLAVYSQYGAVFLVIPLYLALVKHNWKNNRWQVFLGTLIVLVVAVLPLIFGFLLPQMLHQGATKVSHAPIFEKNLFIDYAKGIVKLFLFYFLPSAEPPLFGRILVYLACLAAVLALVGYILRRHHIKGQYLVVVSIISYSLYFLAVLFTFYGYNSWEESRGTFNLGRRYCLFLLPLFIVTIIYGLYVLIEPCRKAKKVNYKLLLCAMGSVLLIFSSLNVVNLEIGWKKDDIRDVVQLWYDNTGYEVTTVVHDWSDANFQFYVMHDDRYSTKFQSKILEAGSWIRNANEDEMRENLQKMGVFNLPEFYYVGPYTQYPNSYNTFCTVMEDAGYTIETVYCDLSALLYVKK